MRFKALFATLGISAALTFIPACSEQNKNDTTGPGSGAGTQTSNGNLGPSSDKNAPGSGMGQGGSGDRNSGANGGSDAGYRTGRTGSASGLPATSGGASPNASSEPTSNSGTGGKK